METPREDGDVHNITLLETASSVYTKSERLSTDDDASTAYLPVNVDSPATYTHRDDLRGSTVSMKADELFPTARRSSLLRGVSKGGNIGLLINYMALGGVHALMQALLYPFLKIYLNMDEYHAASAETIVLLPWSFKVVAAFVSDCFPLRGRRRKPYMLGGWAMCLLFSLVIACLPSETPYFSKGTITNPKADEAGGKYIALFFMASVGLVIADVACDAVTVELTYLEPNSTRGTLLLMTFMARYGAHAFMTFLAAFLCNSDVYGGTFGWGAPINGMQVISTLLAVGAMAATWFWIMDIPHHYQPTRASLESSRHTTAPPSLRELIQALWQLLQRRSMWQMMIVVFLMRVCSNYYVSSTKVVYEVWLSMRPLLSQLFSVLNSVLFVVAAFLLRHRQALFEMSWRRLIIISTLASIGITLIITLFTVWNLIRSSALALIFEQAIGFVDAFAYYVLALAMVEATEPGFEATTYSLLTTLANVAIPMAVSLSQSIGEHFDTYDSEWQSDTTTVRWKVMYSFFLWVFVRLLGLAVLPLFPDQKPAVRQLKETGGTQKKAAMYVCGAAVFTILWSLFTTFLASFERTACLTVSGGEGC
ncbi:hypothetical protein Poli38472_014022 [Pythium oligandrum]|uniref:Transmembrane protein n=1 Tax=Pythium oligandrum TaxID=41045 RepID=A0A8K1CQ73_PYTOL|nr:hypothetical protein Poli38472_014022 [Pythium oligandrum]|eukprot:TMW66710.1 hypothetical protein Poli38472_014022 [Pythium oligandrum]